MTRALMFAVVACAALGGAAPSLSYADTFPAEGKPIRLLVPSNAGGPTDVMARALARELGKELKTNIVVENKGGASGTIAASEVARAEADGHTLLFALDGLVTQTPFIMRSYPLDPEKSLTPVARVAHGYYVLYASSGLPIKDVNELVSYVRESKKPLTYGSFGIGSGSHIYGEVLARSLGVDMMHVPYKGTSLAQQDLLAGRIDLLFDSPFVALKFAGDDRLRTIGVAAGNRYSQLPNVPTLKEGGVGGFDFEVGSWLGIFAPPALDEVVLTKLQNALGNVAKSNEWREALNTMAFLPIDQESPGVFASAIRDDRQRWKSYIESADIRLE